MMRVTPMTVFVSGNRLQMIHSNIKANRTDVLDKGAMKLAWPHL